MTMAHSHARPALFSATSFRERARPHLYTDAAENFGRPHFSDSDRQSELAAAVADGRRTGRGRPSPRALDDIRPFRDAAVLMGIVDRGDEATLILTERTAHLNDHAGQIALPGGKIDAGDADPIDAALREAEEEIGLDRAFVEPIGYFYPYLTGTLFRIVPVLATVRPGFTLTPNANEVADVFEVPIRFLMDEQNHRIGSREFQGATRYFYEMPFGDRYIWGITAGIIRHVCELAYGDVVPGGDRA